MTAKTSKTTNKPAAERRKKVGAKQKAKELEIEIRREKVAKLKLAGISLRQIAQELGCALGTVHSDLEAVLARTVDTADEHIRMERDVSLGRCEVALRAIWPRICRGDVEAINAFVRLDQRRAKLLGLDAPAKQELSGPDGGPIPLATQTSLEQKLESLEQRLTGGSTKPGGTPGSGSGSEG